MEMNFTNVKDFFVNNRPNNKNLLHFIHRCYGLREILKIQFLQVILCIFGQAVFVDIQQDDDPSEN